MRTTGTGDPGIHSLRPSLRLADACRRAVVDHAREEYPRECCGFLIGRNHEGFREVLRARPARNARSSRLEEVYAIDPEDCLVADRSAREEELEIVGFYHSHPDGEARPSEADRRGALPGCSYLIVAVRAGVPGEMRSFRLDGTGSEFAAEDPDQEGSGR